MNCNNLLQQYQEYSFIDEVDGRCGMNIPKAGDMTNMDHYMDTYNQIYNEYSKFIERSYEGCKWYYIVFAPYDKAYLKQYDWFQVKALESCKRWIQRRCETSITTREILECQKTHINVLTCSKDDIHKLYHGYSYNNKFRLEVRTVAEIGDRRRVLAYCLKEAQKRSYKKYLDYLITSKV